tara:strand:- start:1869 stop:2075 length:207 start_codon:yes stop_codon:yes gene_type:complete
MGKTYRNDSEDGWGSKNKSRKKKIRDKRQDKKSPSYNKSEEGKTPAQNEEWLEDYYQDDFEKYKKKKP